MADPRHIKAATPKELEILRFMREFRDEAARANDGFTMNPTIGELAEHFGVSKSTMHEHLTSMVRKWILVEVANAGRARRYEPNPALQTRIAQRQLAKIDAAQ